MLRIAVVDDELAMREQLCGYVRQYAEENHLAVEVVPFADGAAIAMPYQTGFDIIMLDVDMPLLGGMPTAERIREEDKNVVLMFITNMAQCAIHGYEVGALRRLCCTVCSLGHRLHLPDQLHPLRSDRSDQ